MTSILGRSFIVTLCDIVTLDIVTLLQACMLDSRLWQFFLQIHMDKKCKNQVPKACVAKQASPQWPVLLSAFLLLLAFLAGITWYKRLSKSKNIIL